jgi:hypothetical protein
VGITKNCEEFVPRLNTNFLYFYSNVPGKAYGPVVVRLEGLLISGVAFVQIIIGNHKSTFTISVFVDFSLRPDNQFIIG